MISNTTPITFALNSSSSMSKIADDTKGGFNTFLLNQREELDSYTEPIEGATADLNALRTALREQVIENDEYDDIWPNGPPDEVREQLGDHPRVLSNQLTRCKRCRLSGDVAGQFGVYGVARRNSTQRYGSVPNVIMRTPVLTLCIGGTSRTVLTVRLDLTKKPKKLMDKSIVVGEIDAARSPSG